MSTWDIFLCLVGFPIAIGESETFKESGQPGCWPYIVMLLNLSHCPAFQMNRTCTFNYSVYQAVQQKKEATTEIVYYYTFYIYKLSQLNILKWPNPKLHTNVYCNKIDDAFEFFRMASFVS